MSLHLDGDVSLETPTNGLAQEVMEHLGIEPRVSIGLREGTRVTNVTCLSDVLNGDHPGFVQETRNKRCTISIGTDRDVQNQIEVTLIGVRFDIRDEVGKRVATSAFINRLESCHCDDIKTLTEHLGGINVVAIERQCRRYEDRFIIAVHHGDERKPWEEVNSEEMHRGWLSFELFEKQQH